MLAVLDVEGCSKPWTITRVNDFSEIGSARSGEDQDWTGIESPVQYALACILIERDLTSSPNEGQYFVLAENDGKEDEENGHMEH